MTDLAKITIQKLLYDTDDLETIVAEIKQQQDEKFLYVFSHHYNWDDGFDIPYAIIHHPCCCLSTALLNFYLADGYEYLDNKLCINAGSANRRWAEFLTELYHRITDNLYFKSSIAFVPPLTKVQMYKLSKKIEPYEAVFIKEIFGENLNGIHL